GRGRRVLATLCRRGRRDGVPPGARPRRPRPRAPDRVRDRTPRLRTNEEPARMDVRFGVHAGLQHTSIAELRELWSRIETLGFEWISIWDHFYAADATGDPHCLEAVTTHAALAAATSDVLCGSLV